jgi:hypothetical protein
MSKRLVEDCNVIKIANLYRLGWKGMSETNASAENHSLAAHWLRVGPLADRKMTSVTLLGAPGDGQPTETFLIEATNPNYGGLRYWFICSNCLCRTQKLFRPRDEETFACRKCYDLAYASQRERTFHRALRRLRKVRRRLGGAASVCDAFPDKPKRMRCRTWEGLRDLDSRTLNGALFDHLDILGLKKLRKQAKRRINRHPRAANLSLA